MLIDWKNDESYVLINPKAAVEDQDRIKKMLLSIGLKAHVWVGTSGTTGPSKWIALSKQALLTSAASVNAHLCSTQQDVWINALPLFHVGGVGISARSFLSGAEEVLLQDKWDPELFCAAATQHHATLSALTPTQLYDVINKKIEPPKSFRAVIIGGGALSSSLYKYARELGWPLLPSYGMTECGSQVATARLDSLFENASPLLQRLSHVEVTMNSAGCLCIRSPSLFTMAAVIEKGKEPILLERSPDKPFQTDDRGEIWGDHLFILGRADEMIKVSGERVDMSRLNQLFDEIKLTHALDAVLSPFPDERLGMIVGMRVVAKDEASVDGAVKQYNARVLPFERIRHVHYVDTIPRTALGKIIC